MAFYIYMDCDTELRQCISLIETLVLWYGVGIYCVLHCKYFWWQNIMYVDRHMTIILSNLNPLKIFHWKIPK